MKKVTRLAFCTVLILSLILSCTRTWPKVRDMHTLGGVVDVIQEKKEKDIDCLTDYREAEQLLNEDKLFYTTLYSLALFYSGYIYELRDQGMHADIPDKVEKLIKRTEEKYLNEEGTLNWDDVEILKVLYDLYSFILVWTQDYDNKIIPAMENIANSIYEAASNDAQKEWFSISLLMKTETRIFGKRVEEAFSFVEANVDEADAETRYLIMFTAYLAKGNGKEAAHQLNALYHLFPKENKKTLIEDIWIILNTVSSCEIRGIITRDTVNTFLNHYDYKPDIIIDKLNRTGIDAGLKTGDKIREVNGIETYNIYQMYILFNDENDIFKISRLNEPEVITIGIPYDTYMHYEYNDLNSGRPHVCDDAA